MKAHLMDDIVDGIDELGVLLAGHKNNAYCLVRSCRSARLRSWRRTTVRRACRSPPPVCRHDLAIENPNCGVTEPDEMDFRRSLEICMPYLGRS